MFPTESLAPAAGPWYSVALISALSPIAVVALGIFNHRKGQKRDRQGSSVLERIEQKIDDNHEETKQQYRELDRRVDEAHAIATEALSHVVGPDRSNGVRSRVEDLEAWRRDEQERIRAHLERELERQRGLGPRDVGTLSPRTSG